MTPADYRDDVRRFGDAFEEQLRNTAQRIADNHKRPLAVVYQDVMRETRSRLATSDDTNPADNRAALWRARVRLYIEDRPNEPEADSDDDLPPEAPGTTTCQGLPAVAHLLAELAHGFHNAACSGLDMATLRHRLKSLRPTLSRRGGDAVWRVPYEVAAKDKFGDGTHVEKWLARVDVERVKGVEHDDMERDVQEGAGPAQIAADSAGS